MTRILVADDTSENRYLLTALFQGSGYEVQSADNGAEALNLALNSPPDLIITDILMPVMDGFELCRRWKKDERLKGIPLIFYTATYTDSKDERFAISLGAERFVIKPQQPNVLLHLVQQVLHEATQSRHMVSERPLGEEMEVLRQHNEVLFRKLERKVLQLQAEIAERKRIQQELVESQSRLLDAHRLGHIGIWDWNPETDTVTWSEELYHIAGLNPREPVPCPAEQSKLFAPESWTRLTAAVERTLRTTEPHRLEVELVRPDGTRRWAVALGGAEIDDTGRVIRLQGMLQDITEHKRSEAERRKLEEQLRQSQKMEAIGSLAGGVAHDFNNLLSVILGFAEFGIHSAREGDPLREDLIEIKNAGERAATLTKQLLAFSRRQVLDPQPLDLNQVVANLKRMLHRLIGENIELRLAYAPNLGWVRADLGETEQVIMNLVVNARDAMPNGGKLTLETSNVELDDAYAAQHVAAAPGPYVLLSVSDNGCGMDAVTQQRLFEPFFTTKAPGKGTGLGLSTVYGIVKQSGGMVLVYSEIGLGTTIKIYLPRLADGTEAVAPASCITQVPSHGTETILIVEDEEAVRKIIGRVLRNAGFQVLLAANGGEALILCERHQGEIDLVLTDVVMPQVSGAELAKRVKDVRPNVKVLFMSGYADEAIVHHGVLSSYNGFISKPISATKLLRKVRSILDSAPPSSRR